jgi:arylsulfatase A-like enzyme
MLEYMDDVLGRLFDFMERSKLRENTYVMVMSDNGAELYPEERKGMHREVGRAAAAAANARTHMQLNHSLLAWMCPQAMYTLTRHTEKVP